MKTEFNFWGVNVFWYELSVIKTILPTISEHAYLSFYDNGNIVNIVPYLKFIILWLLYYKIL